ncbi:hypothetical protein LTR94_025553, partial [Friedmanniomyces endolithicus]
VLDVYLDGSPRPVGALAALDNGSTRFVYMDHHIAQADAIPLSLSLPLTDEPYGDALTRAFFDNLLPENDQMRRIMDRHRIARDDFVGLLAFLGADCPGAVSCVPEGAGPVKNPGVLATDYDPLDWETLGEFVRRMANGLPLPDEVRDPSPVAGYQQKMALTRLNDGAYGLPRPQTGAPTTHILKTPQVAERRDAELERSAAFLAQAVGLSVVLPEVLQLYGHPAMLIERYDRVNANGVVQRLHQEDFAQALGLPARLKYERRGTPEHAFNTAAVYPLLLRTAEPARAIREFLKLTLFNACVGNADNHAKNHSLLYTGATPRLAPAYDLLPTRMNGQMAAEMGFRIGEATTVEEVRPRDIALLFRTFGYQDNPTLRFVLREVAPLMLTLDAAAGDRALAAKDLDDMIGANLEILSAACGLELDLRERDHFQHSGGGWLSGS